MNRAELIPAREFCTHHKISHTVITQLYDAGVIELTILEEESYIHQEYIGDVERLVRMHTDLDINIEGLEAIANLLHQVKQLQTDVKELTNKLKLYEDI